MSDALDTAASAFDAAINGNSAPAPQQRSAPSGKPEILFDEPGALMAGEEDEGEGDDTETRRALGIPDEDVDPDADPDDVDFDADPDGDPDADPEDEDDDPDAPPVDKELQALLDREFTVMIDGEEGVVPLKEALNGYIRRETFHKRMNAVDEANKIVRTEAETVVADRQRYIEMLADAEAFLGTIIPKEPDWDKLYTEDPRNARELQKRYDEFKGQIVAVKANRKFAEDEAAKTEAKRTAQFAQTEFPKFAAKAKWKDKAHMEKDIGSMRRTALAEGFSEEELASTYDSRMLTVLLKASKYDRMMAARPKPVQNGKKAQTPGTQRATRRVPNGMTRAAEKLNRSGSIEDAANVFAQHLKHSK